jgi:TonB family protein
MGDSPRHRPRGAYAQPGEIDTSLGEAESLRPGPAAEPNLKGSTPTLPSSIPELRSAPSRPVAEWEHKSLGSAHAAESRPSPLRPNPPTNPFYKGLAPAGNVEPSRKGLASAPGLVEGKPAALRLGTDTGLSHANPALQRGLAPPPGIASTPSVPLRLEIVAIGVRSAVGLDIHTLIFETKHVPPPSPRPELKPVSKNPEPLKTPTLSPPRSPQAKQGVSARFELLPDAKPHWNQVGMSAAGQLAILGLALLSPMIFPQTMKTALKFDVIELMQPVTQIPVAPETPKRPAPQRPPKPKVPEMKLEVPAPRPLVPQQPHVFLNLKPLVPKAHTVEEKPPELKQNLKQPEIVLSSNGPKPPAPDTVNAALSKVQTGGFGDPNGIAGPGNPNRRGNINHAGSPGLPGGPGYGNGTGGAQGLRGTVASDGSGWSAAALSVAPPTIRYKPNPAYSAEGLERKIQGDVVLEVIFLASGQIKVTRVVSGLDFGMDDEAIHAAQRIRFTPAMLDGKPVDFPARIRIEFRLVRVENPSELPR